MTGLAQKMWMLRRLLAFLIAPLMGVAIFALVITIRLTPGRLVDYPLEHSWIFIGNWLGATAIGAVFAYVLTVVLVMPAYLFLLKRKRISLKSMLIVWLFAGILSYPFLALLFSTDTDFLEGLIKLSIFGGFDGLLSGWIFFKIHGARTSQSALSIPT